MVVQTSGERGGLIVLSVPVRPARGRAARLGITPAAMESSSSSQSAPSSPTEITGRAGRAARVTSGLGGGGAAAFRDGGGSLRQAKAVTRRAERRTERRIWEWIELIRFHWRPRQVGPHLLPMGPA